MTKRISYRIGGIGARTHHRVVPIDVGMFTLTDRRVVSAGGKRLLEIPFAKLVAVEPLEDGIAISRTGKTKTEYLIGLNRVETEVRLPAARGGRTRRWRLQGVALRRAFELMLENASQT